jgi:hypothetical protein
VRTITDPFVPGDGFHRVPAELLEPAVLRLSLI